MSSGDAEPPITFDTGASSALKSRIKAHYDGCSSYYQSLWGEHVHHGYFLTPQDTKEKAQTQLIDLLIAQSQLPSSSSSSTPSKPSITSQNDNSNERNTSIKVLDTGCGLGGTSRYLASKLGWQVTGITISDVQVKMAYDLSRKAVSSTTPPIKSAESSNSEMSIIPLNSGTVQYLHLDAEILSPHFPPNSFDIVWISEAFSHLPDKPLFFRNAYTVLRKASTRDVGEKTELGRLVIADWVKAPNLAEEAFKSDIEPIEIGMLLPPLATSEDYCNMAKVEGFELVGEVLDISDKVAKTWDISLDLITNPSIWSMAFSMGSDFVAFLRAFQAMRRGFANGTFRYAVLVFEKK